MSVPPNRSANPLGGGWSPEPELRESAPRRYAPSPYPDLNQPNAPILLGGGGGALLLGLILFFVALVTKGNVFLILLGAVLTLGGAALIAIYPSKLKAHRDRAANLVEHGAPVMARIVKVDNSTGDSQYGRVVTYMITMPGANEESRREVKADDRSLPKTIPGPVTALVDFKNNDLELYCVLPYQAVSKVGATAAAPSFTEQTGIPTNSTPATTGQRQTQTQSPTPTPAGGMAGIGNTEPQTPPTIQLDPDDKPKRPASGGAAKLPWET